MGVSVRRLIGFLLNEIQLKSKHDIFYIYCTVCIAIVENGSISQSIFDYASMKNSQNNGRHPTMGVKSTRTTLFVRYIIVCLSAGIDKHHRIV